MTVFSTKIETYLVDCRADEALRDLFARVSTETMLFLESVISELKPSLNYLRQIVGLIIEIAARDQVTSGQVLSDNEWQEILKQKNSRKEKQKFLRCLLERKRYPLKEELVARTQAWQRNLSAEYEMTLKLPDELEGDKLQISLSFSSAAELAQKAEQLKNLASDPQLQAIFNLLLGLEK